MLYVQVDFDRLVAQTEVVRRQNAARDERREVIARQRLNEVHLEMAGEPYGMGKGLIVYAGLHSENGAGGEAK